MQESENIYIDLPIVGTDNKKVDEELKALGLKKPGPYPPSIERLAFKELGFNDESLKKELLENLTNRFIEKHIDINYVLSVVKPSNSFYNSYTLKSGKFISQELKDKIKKYTEFKTNHEKIKNYYKSKDEYANALYKIKSKYTFSKTIYNKPGYLLTIINTKTDKVSFFLVGTKQRLSDSFIGVYDYRVLRAKKVVSDEEINGMIIFD